MGWWVQYENLFAWEKFIINQATGRVHYEFSIANRFSYCMKIHAVLVLLHDWVFNEEN